MPILHVRNIPGDLYDRMRLHASAQHRSLSAEVIALLERGLADIEGQVDTVELLERMRLRREVRRARGEHADSVESIREDRRR